MLPARSKTDIFKIIHSELLNFLPLIKIQAELADLLPSHKKLIFSHYKCNQWRLPGKQGSLPGCLQSCATQPWTKLWPKTSVLGSDSREHLLLQHTTFISQNLQLTFSTSPHLSSSLKLSIFLLFPTLSITQKGTKIPRYSRHSCGKLSLAVSDLRPDRDLYQHRRLLPARGCIIIR